MLSQCRKFAFQFLLFWMAGVTVCNSAYTVLNFNVIDGGFSFSLPGYDLYFTEDDQMAGALQSYRNLEWGHENWTYEGNPALTQYLAAAPGTSTAEMVLAWDFSLSDYRSIQVELYNRVFIFSGDATATLSWSTSGADEDYQDFAHYTTPGQYFETKNVSIPGGASVFFMRIRFEDSTGDFQFAQNQWARAYGGYLPDSLPGFAARFDVAAVPEARSLALVGFACVLAILRFYTNPSKRGW